jgi:hypothetical protein
MSGVILNLANTDLGYADAEVLAKVHAICM